MMYLPRSLRLVLVSSSATTFSLMAPAWAQRIPDDTLGNEGSLVTPNVEVQGELADLSAH